MAPNNNIYYGVGAKTYGASPYRRNAGHERGRTGRASAIVYPESVLTRASTSQNPTRSRIGMQLLRELTQTLPTSPSQISPNTNGSRRLRPRTSRVEQHGPSQMVLNRTMPLQSRTALGGRPMAAGIPVREVSVKESSRRVRIKNQDKESQGSNSISMSNISPMRKASSMAQSTLAPVIMVAALEEPEQEEPEPDNEDTVQQDGEQADELNDGNESVVSAPQADQADEEESIAQPIDEDKEPSVASYPQAEEENPPAGAEEKPGKTAECQQLPKIFPCFRGEYPTRNRAAPYQWFEQTGFKAPGPGTGASPGPGPGPDPCPCTGNELDEGGQMPGEENILTTCEVTEEHFMSIGCDCDDKALWSSGQEAPHFMGGLLGSGQGQTAFRNMAPQQQGRPTCREQQARSMPQYQSAVVQQQQQAPMFRSYPNQNPSSCGLTEMLAQQLHQQMLEAQAQIAQVQQQLNNACGSTQPQQTNLADQSCNEEPYWMCEDLGEDVGCDESNYTTEQSMSASCSGKCQEPQQQQQQEALQEKGSCMLLPSRSCPPPAQPAPSFAAAGQGGPGRFCYQQPQQQEQIPCQQRPPCQQQQQKCSTEQFPCRQQQQQTPPPPCQQQQSSPAASQMQQQQLLLHILQQQQKL
ncbi:PAX-interacting protein 1, partial [Drosophila obscura]|uniref:PAX-interacting protein 1 n=1 Tax=Drosophila obscura TaxID=7282 RepID=UPI001BB11051